MLISEIRNIKNKNGVFYSVIDVIINLTDSKNAKVYWSQLKRREPDLKEVCEPLRLQAANGKTYKTDCAKRAGILRIIQSIPSKKAEPFKIWLANLGNSHLNLLEMSPDEKVRFSAYKGLQDSELLLEKRIKYLGVNDDIFTEILKVGTTKFFNGSIENEPEKMDSSVLKLKTFANEITEFNIQNKGLNGNEILESHEKTNDNIRKFMQKTRGVNTGDLKKEDIKKKQQKGNIKSSPLNILIKE
jgi:hypothetical protein